MQHNTVVRTARLAAASRSEAPGCRAAGRASLENAYRDLSGQRGASINPGERLAAETTLDHLSDRKLQQERAVTEAAAASDGRWGAGQVACATAHP